MVADSTARRLQAVVEGLVAADAFSGTVLLAQDEELDRPVPNLAIGYIHIGRQGTLEVGPRRSNIFGLPPKGTPAGAGYSTVEDMLRF